MKTIYLKFLNIIGKLLFKDRWEGYKTMVINWIPMIIGLWAVIDGTLFPALCEYIPWFCNIQEATFYASLLAFFAFLNQIVRTVTKSKLPTIRKLEALKEAA